MKSSLVALCILLSAVSPGFQLLVHNHIQHLKNELIISGDSVLHDFTMHYKKSNFSGRTHTD